MTTSTIVIDPGDRASALAHDVRARLERRARVVVTPSTLGARERARVAFHNAADVFVCLGDGRAADVATDPRLHHPATKVLRAPRGKTRFGGSIAAEVERLLAAGEPECNCGCADCRARRKGDAVVSEAEHIDVWNEVPLVPQRTGMSCWAAAAAMIVGWRDASVVDPEQIAHAAQRWDAYEGGLEPEDVPALARRWGLRQERSGRYSLHDFRRLLTLHGPLWVGEASPGLHSVVLTGMRGDGTPDGTMLHVADPWPLGRGERYSVTFRDFMRNFEAAAGIDGVDAQILHSGGRGAGASRSSHVRERTTTRSWTTQRG
jgi:Papain-like cysteine protease AvrRpt2